MVIYENATIYICRLPMTFSRLPNVGKVLHAKLSVKLWCTSLFPCKKTREIQKYMLSLSKTTTSWSNFVFKLFLTKLTSFSWMTKWIFRFFSAQQKNLIFLPVKFQLHIICRRMNFEGFKRWWYTPLKKYPLPPC